MDNYKIIDFMLSKFPCVIRQPCLHTFTPDIIHCTPDTVFCMPDTLHCMSDNVICMPDISFNCKVRVYAKSQEIRLVIKLNGTNQ